MFFDDFWEVRTLVFSKRIWIFEWKLIFFLIYIKTTFEKIFNKGWDSDLKFLSKLCGYKDIYYCDRWRISQEHTKNIQKSQKMCKEWCCNIQRISQESQRIHKKYYCDTQRMARIRASYVHF